MVVKISNKKYYNAYEIIDERCYLGSGEINKIYKCY